MKMWTRALRYTVLVSPSNVPSINRYKSDFDGAVREAEKVIGYSTSFLNLRWLVTDEMANVALHIRRLVGTNHPLLETARKYLQGSSVPTWGLIVLLMSKAAGLNSIVNEIEKDHVAGILNSQRVIAEVTEMIRMSFGIHKSIMNIHPRDYMDDLNFGNKIALLSGDYLLSNSYQELANLSNPQVSEIFASALRDLSESEFIGCKPYKPISTESFDIKYNFSLEPYDYKVALGNPRTEWTYRNILGGAGLLAKACQSTMKFAKHPKELQEVGYIFGRNIALAWQAEIEREAFISGSQESFSLVSAPVMLHLEDDPGLFYLLDADCVNYNEVRKCINLGHSLNKTKALQNKFCYNALDILRKLPKSDSRLSLENIVNMSVAKL